jgi:hypothetical protein
MEVVASEIPGGHNDLRAAGDWCRYRRPNMRNRHFKPPTISQNKRLPGAVAHFKAAI